MAISKYSDFMSGNRNPVIQPEEEEKKKWWQREESPPARVPSKYDSFLNGEPAVKKQAKDEEEERLRKQLEKTQRELAERQARDLSFAADDIGDVYKREQNIAETNQLGKQAAADRRNLQSVTYPKKYADINRGQAMEQWEASKGADKSGFQNFMNNPTKWGQDQIETGATNYNLGRIQQDKSKAATEYIKNPTAENKKFLDVLNETYDEFIQKNRDVMFFTNDKGEEKLRGNLITQLFANYTPQLVDQIGTTLAAMAAGTIAAPALVAAGVPAATAAIWASRAAKTVQGVGSFTRSMNVVQGSSYENLISLGVPEEIAIRISHDEAFKSSLIEMGSSILEFKVLGFDKLLGAINATSVETVAKLVAKTGMEKPAQAAMNKMVQALGAYGINMLSEGTEEYLQEILSIEGEKEALGDKRFEKGYQDYLAQGVDPDTAKERAIQDQWELDEAQKKESFKGGVGISAVSGAAGLAFTSAGAMALQRNAQLKAQETKAASEVKPEVAKVKPTPVEAKPPKVEVKPEPVEVAKMPPTVKQGNAGTAIVNAATGEKIDFTYAVVDAKDLIASHDDQGVVNKSYPAELQPRDRTRESSRLDVQNIATKLQPTMLSESPTVQDGAPIVGPDMVVESGNARTAAIRMAYNQYQEQSDAYKKHITKEAERLGVDISNMPQNPVLVRIRTSESNREGFARDANVSTITSMNATDRAQADSKRLTGDVLKLYNVKSEGDLLHGNNKEFVNAILQKLPKNESGALVDKQGNLNQEGIARIQNAVVASAYADADIVSRMGESTSDEIKNVSKSLMTVAPKVALVNSQEANGTLHKVGLGKVLADAAKFIVHLKNQGMTVEQYRNQTQLIAGEFSEEAIKVAESFQIHSRSAKRMTEFMNAALDLQIEQGDPNQSGLMGDVEPATTLQIIERATKREERNEQIQLSRQQSKEEIENEAIDVKDIRTQNAKIGLNLGKYTGNLTKAERLSIDTIGKLLKLKVVFASNVGINNEGQETVYSGGTLPEGFTQHNGFYDAKTRTIFLNMDLEDKAFAVMLHEVTHHIQQTSPAAYNRYKAVALKNAKVLWGNDIVETEKVRAKLLANLDLTTSQVEDEVVANYIGHIFEDTSRITELYWQDKGFARAIVKSMNALLNKIKRFANRNTFTEEQKVEAIAQKERVEGDIRLWESAFKAAIKGEETSSEGVSFSLRESGMTESNKIAGYTEKRVDELISYYGSPTNKNYSKAYVTNISPEDFLNLTTTPKLKEFIGTVTEPLDLARLRKEGQEIFLAYNQETGEVTNHEGRHRMTALKEAGIKSVPITLVPDGSGGRYNREKINYLQLTGQMMNDDDPNAPVYASGKTYVNNLIPVNSHYKNEIMSRYSNLSDVKFSLRDSTGATLTKNQQEYFKDSKVRDKEGNLLRMYHGTNEQEFTKFGRRENTNRPFYFSASKKYAEEFTTRRRYGPKNLYEVYLDIKNPLDLTKILEKETTWIYKGGTQEFTPEMAKIVQAVGWDEEWVSDMLGDDENDLIMLFINSPEFSMSLKENGYDGVKGIEGKEIMFAALDSSQIKRTDNLNPTADSDIRFSLRDLPADKSYRFYGSANPMSKLGHAMFADNTEENYNYGVSENLHAFSVEHNKLTDFNDIREEILSKLQSDIDTGEIDEYPIASWINENNIEEIVDSFNPERIVNSAEGYDNWDFLNWLMARVIEPTETSGIVVDGIKTQDGAVVFNRDIIENSKEALREAKLSRGQFSLRGLKTSPKPSAVVNTGNLNLTPTDGITRRDDIRKAIETAIDRPIKQGKLMDRKAFGTFATKSEIIRLRDAKDSFVLFHEMGHFLDKRMDISQTVTGVTEDELLALGIPQTALNAHPTLVKAEGLAEFVRIFLQNESVVKKQAPNMYALFNSRLANDEKLNVLFKSVRTAVDNYKSQSAEDRIASNMSMSATKRNAAVTFDQLYTLLYDDLNPIKIAEQEMVGGSLLDILKSPYLLARLNRGWQGLADTYLRYGIVDDQFNKTGKSLKEILDTIDSVNNFSIYAVARRAIELGIRDIKTGIGMQDAQEVVTKYDSQYNKAFRELLDYQDAILMQLVHQGILSTADYKKIKAMNKDYIPLQRLTENGQRGGTGKGFQARNPVYGINGSTRTIINPIETIIRNTYIITEMAQRNRVGTAFVNITKNFDGTGKYMDRVPAPSRLESFQLREIEDYLIAAGADPLTIAKMDLKTTATVFRQGRFGMNDNVITVFEEGKPTYYEVHDTDLYRAFLSLDKTSTTALEKIFAFPTKLLRAGAILNTAFMFKNAARDTFTIMLNSKYGFIPIVDNVKGLFHVLAKDDLYYKAMASGALQSSFVSLDRNYLQGTMDSLMERSMKEHLTNYAKNPLKIMQAFAELSEDSSRMGEFARAIEVEGNDAAGIARAAYQTREVSIDFSRGGTLSKSANKMIAFFNSSMQGPDKMVRMIRENPKKYLMNALLYITLPSLALFALNYDDPRYKELEDWEKDLNWIILTKDKMIKIPKPFEPGIIFGTFAERIAAYALKEDPEAFKGFRETVTDGLFPSIVPTAILPYVEALSNYSQFKERDIVSKTQLDNDHPYLQFNNYTSDTAKIIGKMLNVSPLIIENTIYGYGAGLVKDVVSVLDVALQLAGMVESKTLPAKDVEDLPVIRSFMSVAYRNARSIRDFYDAREKIIKDNNELEALGKPENKDWIAEEKKLSKAGTAINAKRKEINAAYGNKKYTPEKQKEIIDKATLEMVNLAREALGKEKIK